MVFAAGRKTTDGVDCPHDRRHQRQTRPLSSFSFFPSFFRATQERNERYIAARKYST